MCIRNCLFLYITAMLTFMSVLLSCADDSRQVNDVVISDDISAEAVLDKAANGTETYQEIQALWRYYTAHRRFAELVDAATPYFDRKFTGNQDTDKSLAAMTGAYLAQAFLFLEDFDSAYRYLGIIEGSLSDYLDYKSSITVNNTAAILALKVEMDYSKAMFHLRTALEYAVALDDSSIQCPTLCNMAAIYYERSDTAGLRYARRAYDIAVKNGDPEPMIYGALHMSQANMVAGKYKEAERYADEASRLLEGRDEPAYISILRLIYGDIYQNIGELGKADSIYECFSADLERQEPGLILEYLNKKGNLLLREGRPKEAEGFFRQGLAMSYSGNNIEDRHHFLLGLSDVYDEMGQDRKALEYYRAYHHFIDSVSLVQKERSFHQLLMNYDKMSYEQAIHRQEMKNMRYSRRMLIISFAFILIALLLAALYMLYRRKNLMYQRLVERHQQYTRKMRSLEDEIDRMLQQDKTSKDEAEAKDAELFSEVENIMKTKKVYRNNDISLEKLSDMLGSNRSYVSRCINKYSGMSFISYVNIKRIEEAVSRLSDLSDETPLKAMCEELGFNSMSAFYRAFQKETGCPPSKYREGIKKMSENQ